jgi:hypothetical protein
MIQPHQVPQKQEPSREAEIEKFFDKELMAGRTEIGMPRSGWSVGDVNRVLDKYRANGWKVTDLGIVFRFEPASG